jgi:uncharacterized protein (TIGR02453 family)
MIQASTFQFLKQLAQNNNREWFNQNKSAYEAARTNVLNFTAELIKLLSTVEPAIPSSLDPRDCVMRIYRDIRFSNDKTPYKTNFGVAISQNGKDFKGPGYYLHIQPGKSFIAGGSWFPPADELKAIRQEIDYNGSELIEIIDNPEFKSSFGDLDREGALKTAPKGYPSTHEFIRYLALKSFSASCQLPDRTLTQTNAVASVVSQIEKIHPLMVFLRNAIA